MSDDPASPLASPEETVIRQAHAWLADPSPSAVALVTVQRTIRSAPRPPGTLMAVRQDGTCVGSVSGGCVEGALVRDVIAAGLSGPPRTFEYGVNAEQAARYGLSCGGQISLVVEFLRDAALLAPVIEALDARQAVRRTVTVADGAATLSPAGAADAFEQHDLSFSQVIGPRWQLLVLGAGDVARYLAMQALALGYRVTVNDPRLDTAPPWIAGPVTFDAGLAEDAAQAGLVDSRSALVSLLHAPHLEDPALLVALRSPAFYVGAMGAADTSARRRERLLRLGADAAQLARLHAPIGLRLGGRSGAEIALAIAAQMTAARYGRPPMPG